MWCKNTSYHSLNSKNKNHQPIKFLSTVNRSHLTSRIGKDTPHINGTRSRRKIPSRRQSVNVDTLNAESRARINKSAAVAFALCTRETGSRGTAGRRRRDARQEIETRARGFEEPCWRKPTPAKRDYWFEGDVGHAKISFGFDKRTINIRITKLN